MQLYVGVAHYGLGAYEQWLVGEGEECLAAARAAAMHLISRQEPDGSWLHHEALKHTFSLVPPWQCGMAQGEAASLLVRLHKTTGEEVFAEAAVRALAPLSLAREDGGVCASLDGRPWPEEYPTDPPSFVLNGAIFAMWGLRDVGVGLGDADATRVFEEGVDALAANLHRFDNGWWSLYSLFPHPVIGVASSFYHNLHITQLQAMDMLSTRPEFEATRLRWASYAGSRWSGSGPLQAKLCSGCSCPAIASSPIACHGRVSDIAVIAPQIQPCAPERPLRYRVSPVKDL